jgi:hypothetical protein
MAALSVAHAGMLGILVGPLELWVGSLLKGKLKVVVMALGGIVWVFGWLCLLAPMG